MNALRTNAESAIRNGTETMLKHRPSLTTMRKDRTMADKPDITQDMLRQLIRYEPQTGRYFWKPRPRDMFQTTRQFKCWNKRYANAETLKTGTGPTGYYAVTILDVRYYAHRVVWLYHKGKWPSMDIDHINGIRTDNRIENLRDVSTADNGRNLYLARNNTSGAIGVYWRPKKKKWEATIRIDGKLKFLGLFTEKEAASAVRRQAQSDLGYHPTHGRAR
jgi:HNH endonuclease